MMADSSKRMYCGHCHEYLTKTVYFKHKRLHYDRTTKQWLSTRAFNPSYEEAFSLEGSDMDHCLVDSGLLT